MKIRLGTIEDKFPENTSVVKFENQISTLEFKAIKRATKEVNEYKQNKYLFQFLYHNNLELHNYHSDIFEKLLKKSVS